MVLFPADDARSVLGPVGALDTLKDGGAVPTESAEVGAVGALLSTDDGSVVAATPFVVSGEAVLAPFDPLTEAESSTPARREAVSRRPDTGEPATVADRPFEIGPVATAESVIIDGLPRRASGEP